jgi:hypothetical protein
MVFDMWSILQLVGTTPNVGAEPERRLKRGREVAHRGEERRALLGTPSIHLCQTLLWGVYRQMGGDFTLPPRHLGGR